MKLFAAVLLATAGCLSAAAVADAAEAPQPSVSVEGVATVGIAQTASAAEANAAYRHGLAAAIADGREKAEFLATETGAKVGSIQQVIERGGSIECVLPAEEGPLTEYAQYKGAQPDIGSVEPGGSRFVAPVEAASGAPHVTVKKPSKKRKHKHKAKKAEAIHCMISTQVGLSYLLT